MNTWFTDTATLQRHIYAYLGRQTDYESLIQAVGVSICKRMQLSASYYSANTNTAYSMFADRYCVS